MSFCTRASSKVVQVLCYSTTVQYDTALGSFLQLYNHTGRCMSLAAVRLQPTTHMLAMHAMMAVIEYPRQCAGVVLDAFGCL